jgi:hypothetical protein
MCPKHLPSAEVSPALLLLAAATQEHVGAEVHRAPLVRVAGLRDRLVDMLQDFQQGLADAGIGQLVFGVTTAMSAIRSASG